LGLAEISEKTKAVVDGGGRIGIVNQLEESKSSTEEMARGQQCADTKKGKWIAATGPNARAPTKNFAGPSAGPALATGILATVLPQVCLDLKSFLKKYQIECLDTYMKYKIKSIYKTFSRMNCKSRDESNKPT
jgi:hypothetical protein